MCKEVSADEREQLCLGQVERSLAAREQGRVSLRELLRGDESIPSEPSPPSELPLELPYGRFVVDKAGRRPAHAQQLLVALIVRSIRRVAAARGAQVDIRVHGRRVVKHDELSRSGRAGEPGHISGPLPRAQRGAWWQSMMSDVEFSGERGAT